MGDEDERKTEGWAGVRATLFLTAMFVFAFVHEIVWSSDHGAMRVVWIIGFGLFAALALWATVEGTREVVELRNSLRLAERRNLRAAGDALRLASTRTRFFRPPLVSGTIDGIDVQLSLGRRGFVVDVHAASVPPSLVLEPERDGASVSRALLPEQVQTGDSIFDEQVFVRGDVAEALVVLGADERRLATRLMRKGVTLRRQRLHFSPEVWGGRRREKIDGGDLADIAKEMVALARGLSSPPSIGERLAHNGAADPNPLTRLANLLCLRERFPDDEVTRAALEAARSDPDSRVRDGLFSQAGELSVAEPRSEGALSLPEGAGLSLVDEPRRKR